MEIIDSPALMTAWADKTRIAGKTICLVPTMGFFHDGHLSLMRKASDIADEVVVSLFVNPIQFGPNEDLARYPRAFERDSGLAEKAGISVLFAPKAEQIYPTGFCTKVCVSRLTETLCGLSRPGHFDGVTTVVAKLFHIIKPHYAIFGAKDFQQLAIIRKMVTDLNWDVRIVAHPIVREKDGLAMSSRNSYLSLDERSQALCLSRALQMAREEVANGETDAAKLIRKVRDYITASGDVVIDYVAIVTAGDLTPCTRISNDSLLALAVKIGRTRLIDNTLLARE